MRLPTLVVVTLVSTPSLAIDGGSHFTTAGKVADSCYGDMSFVQGYVTGMVDQAEAGSAAVQIFAEGNMKPDDYALLSATTVRLWCAPRETQMMEYVAVACKWTKGHLKDRGSPGVNVLQSAFADRWPCR